MRTDRLGLVLVTLGCVGSAVVPSAAAPPPVPSSPTPSAAPAVSGSAPGDAGALPPPPPSVDLRAEMPPVKAQGDRETCAAFSVATLLEAALKRQYGRDYDLSEEYLFYLARTKAPDATQATNIPALIDGVKEKGLLLEQDWAYQPSWFDGGAPGGVVRATDPDVPPDFVAHRPPPPSILARTFRYTKERWRVISELNIQGPEGAARLLRVKRNLGTFRRPQLVGLPYASPKEHAAWDAPSGRIDLPVKAGGAQRTEPSNQHFVVLTGYDSAARVFTFRNSWGASWGNGGYGEITEDLLTRAASLVLDFDGELERPPTTAKPQASVGAWTSSVRRVRGGGLSVRVTGVATNVDGRYLSAMSELVRVPAGTTTITKSNAKPVRLGDAERKAAERAGLRMRPSWARLPDDKAEVRWTAAAPVALDFSPKVFELPTVAALLGSKRETLAVRTVLSVHSDDAELVPLAEHYQSVR